MENNEDECVSPGDNPEATLDKLIADTKNEELRGALQVLRKHMQLNSKNEDRTDVLWSIAGAGDEENACILFGIAWW